jgi:DNA-binding response OmpR family regulator/GNAT superfamily N-acetyltransferase
MPTTLVIRPATATDLPAIGNFIADLGYTARRDVMLAMLGPMPEDRRCILLKGEAQDLGVVVLMSLSSRPVLRLQGWVGTIEELVVRPEVRDRGFGERMLQYAKGLAAERGWVRHPRSIRRHARGIWSRCRGDRIPLLRFTHYLRFRHPAVTHRGDNSGMTNRAIGETRAPMATCRRAPGSAPVVRTKPGQRALVVEDEPDVSELIRYNVTKEGYDVVVVANGAEALKHARELKPEVILLDIMVPQLNGWEVCRRLKQDPETRGISVIMVTGRVEEGDKVLGFEMGADDYVTKPFSPRELIARIRAVVRRGRSAEAADRKHHLKGGDLEIDRHRFEVTMKGQRVDLTPKEFELLAALVGTPGRVFGREELLDMVWGEDGFVEPRTVDVHVARLRAKFSAARAPMPGIETVRGVGYRFREPEATRSFTRS